jgi:hypothetical protein
MNSLAQHQPKADSGYGKQHLMLSVGVVVVGEGPECAISEKTRTVIVNAHGANILLEAPVVVGQLLTVKNVRTQEELFCRVINVNPHDSGKKEVRIEFMQPVPRFWRIAFPSSEGMAPKREAA